MDEPPPVRLRQKGSGSRAQSHTLSEGGADTTPPWHCSVSRCR